MKSALSGKPLLVAEGDIPTTRLLARVLEAGYGQVDVRTLDALFGADIARSHVVLSRVCQPSHAWLPRYFAARGLGYLYFLDDNFWELTPEVDAHLAPFYQHPAVIESLDSFVAAASATVVMSDRLAKYIRARFPGAKVEYVNPPFDVELVRQLLATTAPSERPAGQLRIGYPTSRRNSVAPLLVPVVRHVAQKYAGSVEFDFVGWMPDNLACLPGVCLHPQITDYNEYLHFKISRRWDIGLAPLLGRLFEGCKTNNKYREYGGCRVAGIYSRVSPYSESVVHKQNGYLSENTVDEWIFSLETLISSPSLRTTIVENAFIDVDRNYSQQATARHWVEMARPYANECRVSMAA